MTYAEFLRNKQISSTPSGFSVSLKSLNHMLFDWQKDVVRWALAKGKSALFEGCGLGKTPQQLEWSFSRQGIPDYLITFRKPGTNTAPVTKTHDGFPVELWQNYASPVWMDIQPNDTLQRESAREEQDERHICPLQLGVIERAIRLWTNPGDVVLSPFAGIGSEGYQSLRMDREFVGVELKPSYFKQACLNLRRAESTAKEQHGLFADADEVAV